MKFSRGLIRDRGRRCRGALAQVVAVTGTPSGQASLVDFAPAVMNQNYCGSCVGHGTSGAIYTTCAAQGKQIAFVPSPRRLYATARCMDRADDNPNVRAQYLPPLEDVGTQVLSAVNAIQVWGILPTDAPAIGADNCLVNTDCVPKNVNDEPTLLDLEQMAQSVVVGAHEVDSHGDRRVTEFCLALDSGFAIDFGTFVGSDFERYNSDSEPIGAQDETDPYGGGHCMYLYGYRTDASGKRIFLGRNSWGCEWGRVGDFECTEEFVKQIWEAYVMNVEVVQ